MIRDHIYSLFFNGVNLSTAYGVHTTGNDLFNSPEYDYEFVEVPGRSGDLTIDKHRYKNTKQTYHCFVANDGLSDFASRVRNLRNFLLTSRGYKRLEDTYHSDEYRMACFVGPFETDAILLRAGEFDLTFDCKPQRFLKSGEETSTYEQTYGVIWELGTHERDVLITNDNYSIGSTKGKGSHAITNPTLQNAKPILRVYGTGTFSIASSQKSYTVTIASHGNIPYIDIDCDLGNCYYGSTNCNGYVTFSNNYIPEFVPGVNYLDMESTITKMIITPRWWVV